MYMPTSTSLGGSTETSKGYDGDWYEDSFHRKYQTGQISPKVPVSVICEGAPLRRGIILAEDAANACSSDTINRAYLGHDDF